MKILLVEPDTVLADVYKAAFGEKGASVRHAASAQKAIEMVDADVPDVIVLELQMAGHSGVEFLHELRSYEDWSSVPVVVHSNVPQVAFGVDGAVWDRLGVVRYLYKADTQLGSMVAIVLAMDEKASI